MSVILEFKELSTLHIRCGVEVHLPHSAIIPRYTATYDIPRFNSSLSEGSFLVKELFLFAPAVMRTEYEHLGTVLPVETFIFLCGEIHTRSEQNESLSGLASCSDIRPDVASIKSSNSLGAPSSLYPA